MFLVHRSSLFHRETGVESLDEAPTRIAYYKSWNTSQAGNSTEHQGSSLALYVDCGWLRQVEGQSRFGAKVYVFLAGHIGREGARSSTDRSSDQRTFASASQRANQQSSASTSSDPSPVALLVIAAAFPGGVCLKRISLAVHIDGFNGELQARAAPQPARWARIHNQSFDVSTLWNDCAFVDDDWLGNGSAEMITGPVFVARQSLIKSDSNRRLFGECHRLWPASDRCSRGNDTYQRQQDAADGKVVVLSGKHGTSAEEDRKIYAARISFNFMILERFISHPC